MNTPHPSGRLARWGLALQEVNLHLHIHYRPGKKNANADALSRSPPESGSNTQPFGIVAAVRKDGEAAKGGDRDGDSFSQKQRSDPELLEIATYLESGELPQDPARARELTLTKSHFLLKDGVLYHIDEKDKSLRIINPKDARLDLFHTVHDGKFSGHLRDVKIHGQLSRHYWWPHMRRDIVNWCRSCLTCATRRPGRAVKLLLTPIPVSGPFDRVGVDVIQFPKSVAGNKYAVVFVDYLTKWPEVFAVKDQTALTIAKLLMTEIVPRHGVPSELLSDRGTSFLSSLMYELYRLLGIKKINTTAYHPQTEGLVERFNRTLTDMLAKTVEVGGADWDVRLPYVLFSYRSSLQESTQESPFYLLYGRDPQLPVEEMLVPQERASIEIGGYTEEVTKRMSDAWETARQQVQKAQKRQKQNHDRNARPATFSSGDRVFVYMPAKTTGKTRKFARPYHGP